MNGSSYIPSFDFRLFELPQFSPLQAQEFGVETIFGASDPPWFVDRSIDQLFGLGNMPFFQGAEDVRERLRRTRDEADRLLREAGGVGGSDCPQGPNIFGGCGPIIGSAPNKPGDASVGDDPTKSGQKVGGLIEQAQAFFKAMPAGSGTFLIALLALVFIFLFVRK